MYKALFGGLFGLLLLCSPAMATCSFPAFSNGSTADALAVNANFSIVASCTAPSASPVFSGNMGIGTTQFGWGSLFDRVVDIGLIAAISEIGSSNVVDIDNNLYYNGSSYIHKTANYAQLFRLSGSNFQWIQGNNGSAGSVVTYTTPMVLDNNGNLTITGCLNFNGGTTGTCISDERVKKNIKPFTSVGLAEISALRPVTYSYNGLGGTPNDAANQDVRAGLVAQQVQAVAPSLVTTIHRKLKPNDRSAADLLEVKYGTLTFGLINAVKELKAENDSQTVELGILRKQVADLQHKVGVQTASK